MQIFYAAPIPAITTCRDVARRVSTGCAPDLNLQSSQP